MDIERTAEYHTGRHYAIFAYGILALHFANFVRSVAILTCVNRAGQKSINEREILASRKVSARRYIKGASSNLILQRDQQS